VHCSIAMTDWDDFQVRARRAVPQQELKPKRCWVGVLSHEKAPQDQFTETDFVWMIGHPVSVVEHAWLRSAATAGRDELTWSQKIPISRIRETYQNRFQDVDFQLKFRDVIADNSDTVKSFLAPNSDLVLFVTSVSDQPQQPTAQHPPSVTEPENRASQDRTASPPLARRVKVEPLDGLHVPAARDVPVNQIIKGGNTPCVAHVNTPPNVPQTKQEPDEALATLPSLVAVQKELRPEPEFHHMDQETQVAFDPERFFKREPSQEPASQEEIQPTDRSIRELIAQNDPRLLEAGVAQALEVLQSLKLRFSQHTSRDAVAWTEAIDKLIPHAQRKRTIVGVVGNTGAGKSSVINAMLDEERLVPTNCMRACTAVVTEMVSYS
jgi:hypothetical protein